MKLGKNQERGSLIKSIITEEIKLRQRAVEYAIKHDNNAKAATGLDIDDGGNFYDSLSKELDNDGIPDRYDNDFNDSDNFESTYDVEGNLYSKEEIEQKSEDKPSILDR